MDDLEPIVPHALKSIIMTFKKELTFLQSSFDRTVLPKCLADIPPALGWGWVAGFR